MFANFLRWLAFKIDGRDFREWTFGKGKAFDNSHIKRLVNSIDENETQKQINEYVLEQLSGGHQ